MKIWDKASDVSKIVEYTFIDGEEGHVMLDTSSFAIKV